MLTNKNFDINEDGYSVRCRLLTVSKNREFDRVIICTHGFGGSKDNASITKFAEKESAKHKDDAVIAFDWPCHGQDARKKLILEECSHYITLVVNYAKDVLKAKYIYNYSVSLGAFLTLNYIAKKGENPFTKIALRSPSIKMYELMLKNVNPNDMSKLKKGKDVMIGFERKMKVDQKFFDDLKAADITKHEYFDWADDIIMLHGTKDSTVPIEDSQAFAENNVIEFIPVENADHPFKNPQYMDLAIHTIIEFFAPEE